MMPFRGLAASSLAFRGFAVVAAMLLAGTAAAQERCEGTLCDLYYRNAAPETAAPAQPAKPTPLTVPSMPSVSGAGSYLSNMFSGSGDAAPSTPGQPGQQAAARQEGGGFLQMGGGGITGRSRSGECGGTICDLIHGHTTGEDSDASMSQSFNGVPASRYGRETASAEPVAPSYAAAEPQAQQLQPAERRVARAAPKPPPACALKGGDPWACYRH